MSKIYPLTPPMGMTQIPFKSNTMTIPQQGTLQRQLAAVIELLDQNARYLESFERSWIEHIIGEAVSVTVERPGSPESLTLQSDWTHANTGDLHTRINIHGLASPPQSPARPVVQGRMNAVLATSRSLNSANSLLSCCHDRWLWLQSLSAKRTTSQSGMDDLQELMSRQRQRRNQRHSAISHPLEHTQPLRQDDKTSTTSSRVANTNNDGSENSLQLTVDDTIEQWCKNAEDALNESTARLQAVVGSDRSPAQQQAPELYGSPPYMTEHENPSFVTATDATLVPTYMIARRYTQQQVRKPLPPGCPMHKEAIIACAECHSRTANARSQQFEAYRGIRSAGQPTLHNSFDKESINTVSPPLHDALPPLVPSMTSRKHSASSCRHSPSYHHLQPATSHMSLQTTAVSAESNMGACPDASKNDALIFGQRVNYSTNSIQSRYSRSEQTPRSRGRRWLEQQSDVLPQQSNSVRGLVV